jgi:alkylation response protein AidB-like acyl-CoA dehydrogenase
VRLPGEQEQALRDACREVLSKHSTSTHIRIVAGSDRGFDPEFWDLAVQLGWTALAVPELLGGLGGTVGELSAVAEELGRSGQPSPLVQTLAVAYVLGRYAADDAVAALLHSVVDGAAVLTWAGVGPDSPAPVEVVDGPGGSVLRGTVEFVPDAQCATHLALPVHRGDDIELVVVTLAAGAGSPSATIAVVPTLDLTRRYARVVLDGVQLPADAVRLPAAAAALLFDVGVVLQCAESTGLTRRLLEMTITYAAQREQFGRPIGSFQAIKHRIADLLIEAEGCRVATREAADALDAGTSPGGESVSIAKSWVGRAASFVASHALQIHGGIGFSWEHDLHLFLRRAKVNELLLGSPAWHDERLYRSVLEDRSVLEGRAHD